MVIVCLVTLLLGYLVASLLVYLFDSIHGCFVTWLFGYFLLVCLVTWLHGWLVTMLLGYLVALLLVCLVIW